MAAGRIRIGVGGWTYDPWRGTFFPEGLAHARELGYAAERLTSIEVNGTFYRTQSRETFAKWRDAAPEGFVYALKAPRYATNRRVLAEAGDSIERFVSSGIDALGDKLGPINWQFAPTKRLDAEDFAAFLDLLPRRLGDRPLRHAVELRHPSFDVAVVHDLARDRGVAIVRAGDAPHPWIDVDAADFVYVRIMGTREGTAVGYEPDELDAWARRATDWAAQGRDVYLYVISGHKALNPAAALALIQRV